jgi:hypothetical protein
MKRQVVLVGPFVGELSWEYFHFAPYIIYLKKKSPHDTFVIFTRQHNFDLYGIYADVFVPLRLDENNVCCFKKENITGEDFNKLLGAFINKFKTRFKIKDIIYPDITSFYYKVKWQFPRSKMDYDFQPRNGNIQIVDKIFHEKERIIFVDSISVNCDLSSDKYFIKTGSDFFCQVSNVYSGIQDSTLGCYLDAIKRSEFVVGNLKGDISRLALLLKTPLIAVNEELSDDQIHLINPLNTPVIRCSSAEEGIEIYENNF